jgi:hypothetical protein
VRRFRFLFLTLSFNSYSNPAGPTHQPIALASFYRALPNINLIRPADAEECMGMWTLALSDRSANTPSIFALSRQPVPLLAGSDRSKVHLGAYVIWSRGDEAEPELTIIGTGAEVSRAIATAEALTSVKNVRVVSMPSQRHFDAQDAAYRREVIPSGKSLVVAIEAWASYGWAKYAHASLSMQSFVSRQPRPLQVMSVHSSSLAPMLYRDIPRRKNSCTITSVSTRRIWRTGSMYGRRAGKPSLGCQALESSRSFCSVCRVIEKSICSIVVCRVVSVADLYRSDQNHLALNPAHRHLRFGRISWVPTRVGLYAVDTIHLERAGSLNKSDPDFVCLVGEV